MPKMTKFGERANLGLAYRSFRRPPLMMMMMVVRKTMASEGLQVQMFASGDKAVLAMMLKR